MRIIIVGAGEVGYDIAQMLSLERHDVIVLDRDGSRLAAVRERLDVMVVQGSGTSAEALERCGVRKADLLIAVTSVDEANIIACMLADRIGVATTVARVRSGEYSSTTSVLRAADFGIDLIINPEDSTAAEVLRLLRRASATDVFTFAGGQIQLLGIRLDSGAAVIGKSLQDIAMEFRQLHFRVMAISRGIRTILPRGDEQLTKNDQIFVLGDARQMPEIVTLMGKSEARLDQVMILGGKQLGARIARQLSHEKGKRIKLIEPDVSMAQQLAEELENVLVIHGEATDVDLLVAEGLGEMDAFVTVTDHEESNLVLCLLAKHLGVRKTVALLSEAVYIPFSAAIGLDAAVSKKLAVSREVMRFLRGSHVLSVATVHGLDAEILEIEAFRDAPITRQPLKDLKLPRGVLLGAVIGSRGVEVAKGETRVHAGDRAIVFALPARIREVEALFGGR